MASVKQPNNSGTSKVYWSDDVIIDPNIFFGTAKVAKVNSLWNRIRTPTHDVTNSRPNFSGFTKQPAAANAKGRWNKSLVRLGSVKNLNPSITHNTQRRGTLLVEKIAETARVSRQNSFDRGEDNLPSPSPGIRRLSSITKASEFIKKFTAKHRSSSDSDIQDLSTADNFRMMVKRVQMERKLSEGENPPGQIVTDMGSRRTVSFGDVTMGALSKIGGKKKLARLHKWSVEANRKKQLMAKFRRAAHIIIFCSRLIRDHTGQSQESNEFTPFMKIDFGGEFEPADLLFDPSKYKANKQTRISDEFIRIMSLEPHIRTQQEIYYVQIALRNIQCFQDFPARMQRKIAESGLYESFEPQRLIVRQGHPASSYYFILSGAVAVMVLKEGTGIAEPVAYLTKGQTFGELAIIKRSHRASSIIAREECQFLTISVDDYHNIFMSGGVKTMNDPDHDEFLQSLSFMRTWPLHLLSEQSNKCLFLYFKRGDVLVKDSQYSDWLIVIKSGSVAVLKKLKKVQAYEWRNHHKGPKFVSEKEKREKQVKRSIWRKMVLPELNIPLKGNVDSREGEDTEGIFDSNGDPIPFTHPDPAQQEMVSPLNLTGTSRKIWNFGNHNNKKNKTVHDRDDVHHVQIPQIAVTSIPNLLSSIKDQGGAAGNGKTAGENSLPQAANRLQVQPNQNENSTDEKMFKFQIRTINTDLDSGFERKDPDDITPADLNPEFVHVQTLTKGRVFGLSDLILGQQTSFCVVSNGADCLLISKQMFAEHMPEALHRKLRLDLCPYPSEKELQESLQVSVDWHAFKEDTLMKTLNTVSRKKHRPLSHQKTVTPL